MCTLFFVVMAARGSSCLFLNKAIDVYYYPSRRTLSLLLLWIVRASGKVLMYSG